MVSNIFYFHPYLGRCSPNLTGIFFRWVETQPPTIFVGQPPIFGMEFFGVYVTYQCFPQKRWWFVEADPLFPVYTGITRIKCLKEVKTIRSLGKTPPKRVLMMVWGSQTLPPKKCSSLGLIGQFCPDSTRVTKTVLKMYMLYKKEVGNQQERLQQGKKKNGTVPIGLY